MQKRSFLLLALAVISAASCGSDHGTDAEKAFPVPGTVVASAEMPVVGDTLNHFMFSVKVIADSNVREGVYDIDADYGPNFAAGQMVMPKGGEDLKPVIRKGDGPNTFIIGFRMKDDTTFYDYYEVSSDKKATKMRYTKAYTF